MAQQVEAPFSYLFTLPQFQPSRADLESKNGHHEVDNGEVLVTEEESLIPQSLEKVTERFARLQGIRYGVKRRPHSHSSKDFARYPRDPRISQEIDRANLGVRRSTIPLEEIELALDGNGLHHDLPPMFREDDEVSRAVFDVLNYGNYGRMVLNAIISQTKP